MNVHPAAEKVTEVISHGLVSGWGKPEPGQLCVEAAICLALGEPHETRPSCVGAPQHSFAMRLNDARWPSDQARAEGMLPLALRQLGTSELSHAQQVAFCRHLAIETVRQILPVALRAAARLHPDSKHRDELEARAAACQCADAANAAYAAANAAYAAANAAYAAYAAAYAAANAAYAAYAAADAANAANAANAAAYAANAANAANADVLKVAVQIGIEAIEAARSHQG